MSSYGQQLLERYMSLFLADCPKVNFRPEWLFGMELDLYYELTNLGVEFQGDQHYIPVYGQASCWDQRRRDREKKRICRERGVAFLQIDASDLEHSRLSFKLKKILGHIYGLKQFIKRKEITPRLLALNKEAKEYRKTLTRSFGAVTAKKHGYGRKVAKFKWLTANGYYSHPPKTPQERRAIRDAKKKSSREHKANLAAQGLTVFPA